MENLLCPWDAPIFFIISSTAPTLLYYAYIPIILITLFYGVYVLKKDNYSIVSKLLFLICTSFCLWVANIVFEWTSNNLVLQMFSWQMTAVFEFSIIVSILYFVEVFISKKDIPFSRKLALSLISLPVIFLLPTHFNIGSFYLLTDDCGGNIGHLWDYIYIIEICSVFWIAYIGLFKYRTSVFAGNRKQAMIFTVGVIVFMSFFFASGFFGDITNNYNINVAGPIGMAIFLGFLSYMIVRFKAFNIKLLSSQMLIAVLFCLVFAMFFVRRIENVKYTLAFTLIFIVILGRSLIRGVKKEVESREKIEELAASLVKSNDKLESANVKLKELDKLKSEFLSLASHQIRNPLTAIKGYASLVLDGTYGEVSQSVREAVDRMYQSTQSLVVIVGDFLDISRIEQGTMKYDFTSFDIKKLAEQVVGEFKPNIMKAGLTISSLAGPGDYFINADQGKIKQVIGNLIDNAIKYTPHGSIKVALSRHSLSDGTSGRVRVTVSDTGVGIDETVIPQLFAKFTRDKDAFKTNVSGTGLGLYLAKQMIQAHHGKIWAESDGKGKGSRLIFELDGIR